jgi:hypothetical protein
MQVYEGNPILRSDLAGWNKAMREGGRRRGLQRRGVPGEGHAAALKDKFVRPVMKWSGNCTILRRNTTIPDFVMIG